MIFSGGWKSYELQYKEVPLLRGNTENISLHALSIDGNRDVLTVSEEVPHQGRLQREPEQTTLSSHWF